MRCTALIFFLNIYVCINIFFFCLRMDVGVKGTPKHIQKGVYTRQEGAISTMISRYWRRLWSGYSKIDLEMRLEGTAG